MQWWEIDSSVRPGAFDYIAMGVTGLGFVIAFWQLARTRSALSASQHTEKSTQTVIIQNQITSNLIELQSALKDLDHALALKNDDLGARTLVRYSALCSSTAAHMRKLGDTDLALIESMESSSMQASGAKADLMMRRANIQKVLIPMYSDMMAVSTWTTSTSAQMIFTVPIYGTQAKRNRKQER